MKAESYPPLVELTLARFREFARESGAVFWTFGFPLLLTVALGIAFRNQPPPTAAVGVLESASASQTAEVLSKADGLTAKVVSAEEAEKGLRTGQLALVIEASPEGTATYRFDPTRPEAKAVRLEVNDALQRSEGRQDVRPARDVATSAPGARYIDWLVPGLLGMQLMNGSLWGIAFAIVNARQRKLLKRLAATPMRRADYLLSFILSRFTFMALEVPVLLGFAAVTFGVEVRGSLLAVVFVALLGAASFAGIGLLCAARSENTETANGLVNLVTLPMFVLSGVFFTSARFPAVIQPFLHLLPLTALNEALRALVNDGAPLSSLLTQMVVMAVWAVIPFGIALRIFRWS